MAKKEIYYCDCCGVILHPANWWHDAEICCKCAENVPITMKPKNE